MFIINGICSKLDFNNVLNNNHLFLRNKMSFFYDSKYAWVSDYKISLYIYIYIYIYTDAPDISCSQMFVFFIVIESDTCTTDESCWLSLGLFPVFWLCFFLLESMERSRNTLITHVHVRYDLWFHLWNRLCCRNDSKSVHISVLRSVCLIMCLWLSLWMFWLYCVVNKIQIIKKCLTFSLTCLNGLLVEAFVSQVRIT